MNAELEKQILVLKEEIAKDKDHIDYLKQDLQDRLNLIYKEKTVINRLFEGLATVSKVFDGLKDEWLAVGNKNKDLIVESNKRIVDILVYNIGKAEKGLKRLENQLESLNGVLQIDKHSKNHDESNAIMDNNIKWMEYYDKLIESIDTDITFATNQEQILHLNELKHKLLKKRISFYSRSI